MFVFLCDTEVLLFFYYRDWPIRFWRYLLVNILGLDVPKFVPKYNENGNGNGNEEVASFKTNILLQMIKKIEEKIVPSVLENPRN